MGEEKNLLRNVKKLRGGGGVDDCGGWEVFKFIGRRLKVWVIIWKLL